MDKVNDGGPAFPLVAHEDWREIRNGMTLRDYFATHASDGDVNSFIPTTVGGIADLMVSLGWISKTDRDRDVTRAYTQDQLQRLRQWARYRHADAMLHARGAQ